jgi:hypothetical protein
LALSPLSSIGRPVAVDDLLLALSATLGIETLPMRGIRFMCAWELGTHYDPAPVVVLGPCDRIRACGVADPDLRSEHGNRAVRARQGRFSEHAIRVGLIWVIAGVLGLPAVVLLIAVAMRGRPRAAIGVLVCVAAAGAYLAEAREIGRPGRSALLAATLWLRAAPPSDRRNLRRYSVQSS